MSSRAWDHLSGPRIRASWALPALATLAACSACASKSPGAASVATDVADIAAPPPSPPPRSRFSVPLKYDFAAILRIVERSVPVTIGSMDSVHEVANDSRRHYAYVATRSPFIAFADGDSLHLVSTIEYSARGYYKPIVGPTISAGCGGGEQKPRLAIELTTPISVSPSWRLVSHVKIARAEPMSLLPRDHCDVSILHRDVTERVVAAAREGLTQHVGDIDRRIAEVDLRSHAEGWWRLLSKPIHISSDVWLVLGPERLRMGHVRGQGSVLTVPVSLDARPEIITSAGRPSVSAPPLPDLGHDSIGAGFHIVMDGVIDYVAASQGVTRILAGTPVTTAGRTIRIGAVSVQPAAGGKLSLGVSFAGDANGTLHLIGTPSYDRRLRQVSVPDVDFDLITDNQLLSAYAWLKSDVLRGTLRRNAHWSAALAIDRARELLRQGLNRRIGDAMTLSAKIDSVSVTALYVTRDGLIVRGEAVGSAGVSVTQR
jgi:Domain of unknown function (DUF4403)